MSRGSHPNLTDGRTPRLGQHAQEHEPDAPRKDRRRCGGQDAESGKGENKGPRRSRHHRPVCAGHTQ